MSHNQELAMGQQSDPEIINFFGMYENDKMQAFINEKGTAMAKVSHRPELDYKFRILDSPVINAFAVPGGYVYFTRGIMAHFNNEAEFAGVLGHEIGHITARHSARQYSSQMIGQLGFVLGMVISEDFRKFSDLASAGLNLAFLKFSRNHESQSDKLGVEYSTKVGYNAHEMANFFSTLSRMREGNEAAAIPTFMSTHPDPGDRQRKVGEMATKKQQELNAKNLKVNRDQYLRMIDGLVYGEDPRQGYVENNKFYQPEMLFEFPIPNNWKTVNSPSQVQIAPADGKALIILTLAQEKSLQAAKSAAIAKDSLKVLSSSNIRVNGLPALEFTANLNEKVRILTYLIQYNNLIYKFHGLSETPNFNSYKNTFISSFKNFKKLTDQSKINVKPERIKVKTVTKTGSLQQVLLALNMKQDRLKELALINGMELTDRVNKGSLIKVLAK